MLYPLSYEGRDAERTSRPWCNSESNRVPRIATRMSDVVRIRPRDATNCRVSLSVALVICTRHRAADVAGVLATITVQTPIPQLVAVVDSSDDGRTEVLVRNAELAWPSDSTLLYVHASPSLSHQRIVGIAQTQSDIVMFVDDDVRLEPGYCAAVLDVFERDQSGSIGGVGGFIVGQAPRRVRRFDVFVGLDSKTEGVMLRSGRNIPVVLEPAHDADVDWLSGATMSYRRSVLAIEPPDEVGFPFEGEDADLSFRVRAHARLVLTPRARAIHLESQTNRVRGADQAKAELCARLLRVANNPERLSHRAAIAAGVAQLLKFAVIGLVTGSRRRFGLARGTAQALRKRP